MWWTVLISTLLIANAERLRYDEIPMSEAIRHMQSRNRPREPKSDFLSMPEDSDRVPFRITDEIQVSTEVPIASAVQSKEDSAFDFVPSPDAPEDLTSVGASSESVRFGLPLVNSEASVDQNGAGGNVLRLEFDPNAPADEDEDSDFKVT